jgi:hypothetical protein
MPHKHNTKRVDEEYPPDVIEDAMFSFTELIVESLEYCLAKGIWIPGQGFSEVESSLDANIIRHDEENRAFQEARRQARLLRRKK